jgi:hypothetical protein
MAKNKEIYAGSMNAFFYNALRPLSGQSRLALSRHRCRLCLATPTAEFSCRRFHGINFFRFLPGRHPHDADGVADYVRGALLPLRGPLVRRRS